MKTVFILIDAFRWDYIDPRKTPNLFKLAQEGVYVQRIKPGVGFCERTEILTGTRPDKSLNFTSIGYSPRSSPYRKYKNLITSLSFLDKYEILSSKIRIFLNLFFQRRGVKLRTYNIPFSFLSFFDLTEDRVDHRQNKAFLYESLLDVMRESGKQVFYDSFTALGMPSNGDDNKRIRLMIDKADQDYDLYLLYMGEADSIGHIYGPYSEEAKKMVARVDKKIEILVDSFYKRNEDSVFILLGDHGMAPVHTYFNVKDRVEKNAQRHDLKTGKDYLMFLDSTLARFWCFNNNSIRVFSNMLSEAPFVNLGRVVEKNLASKQHIPYCNRTYGDMIWWANKGVMIYPDFYHLEGNVRGMHGYTPDHSDSKGFCVISGSGIPARFIQERELIDICPTICDLLGIHYPSGNQGRSLL